MHWGKFMKQAEEQRQQYADGLITEAELLAGTQVNLNTMISDCMMQAKATLKVFKFDIIPEELDV